MPGFPPTHGRRKNLCGHKRPLPVTLFIVLGRAGGVKAAFDLSHCHWEQQSLRCLQIHQEDTWVVQELMKLQVKNIEILTSVFKYILYMYIFDTIGKKKKRVSGSLMASITLHRLGHITGVMSCQHTSLWRNQLHAVFTLTNTIHNKLGKVDPNTGVVDSTLTLHHGGQWSWSGQKDVLRGDSMLSQGYGVFCVLQT